MRVVTKALIGLAAVSFPSVLSAQDITVTVNANPIRFDGTGPRSVDGRVLVPLRGIFEALGAYVEWIPSTRTVAAQRGGVDLQLRIGDRIANLNGRNVLMDVPAQIYRGSTMVPLRFISEALGADVRWEAATRTVLIATTDVVDAQPPVRRPVEVQPPTGIMPEVRELNVKAERWVRANQPVEIEVVGTPGAVGTFEIPGITRGTLRETSPGRYVGTWTPSSKDQALLDASVVARLELNGRERIIQSGTTFSIDATPPTIRSVIPDRSRVTTNRPTIAVLFDDAGGSGIDPASVQLRINGVTRTREASITGSFLTYQPPNPLPTGENRVEVSATDKAGNAVSGAWSFVVAEASDIIRSISHTGNQRLEPGDVLTVRLEGEAGGQATFSIGSRISDIQMRESSPGVYVGEYVVRRGDVFDNQPIVASLRTRTGETYNIEAAERLRINAGVAGAPRITTPTANARVESPLVVRGVAEPNSRVRVRIEYSTNALGLLRLTGVVFDRILETDARGNFTTGDIRLEGVAGGEGTEYTIITRAVDSGGRESDPTTVKVRRA